MKQVNSSVDKNQVLKLISDLKVFINQNADDIKFENYPKLQNAINELQDILAEFKETRLSQCLKKIKNSKVEDKYDFMWVGLGYNDIIITTNRPVSIPELLEQKMSLLKDEPVEAVFLGRLEGRNPDTIIYRSGTTREVNELESVEELNSYIPNPISDIEEPIIKVKEYDGYEGVVYKLRDFHEADRQEMKEVYNTLN